MTEGKWSTALLGFRAVQTRIERLAGDQAVLSDEILEDDAATASDKVERWGNEAGRIARELADMVGQVDRLLGPRESAGLAEVDESADTAVLDVGAFATPEDEA